MDSNGNVIFCHQHNVVRTYIAPTQRNQCKPYIALRCVAWKLVTFTNVYRPSDNPTEVDMILKNWNPPANTFIAGDMNAGDVSWDPDNPDYHGGASLANYMLEHGLDCLKIQEAASRRPRAFLLQPMRVVSCHIIRSLHLRRPHS